jgi:hypothetical protein
MLGQGDAHTEPLTSNTEPLTSKIEDERADVILPCPQEMLVR